MAAPLQGEDLSFANKMREIGVARKIDDSMIDRGRPLILVACGDCDHRRDIIEHTTSTHGVVPHELLLNGGPLGLLPGSPVNGKLPKDLVLMEDLINSIVLKNTGQIVLMPHGVCGAAMILGRMSFEDVYRDAIQAHELVRRVALERAKATAAEWASSADPGMRVVGERFSVDRLTTRLYMHHYLVGGETDKDKRETRFVDRAAWERYTNPAPVSAHPYAALHEFDPKRAQSGPLLPYQLRSLGHY